MPIKDKKDRNEYQRKWVAARRAAFFEDKFCAVCGVEEDLELDHINPREKVTHKVFSMSKANRDKEIEKCQILCHYCHQIKSLSDMTEVFGIQTFQHGTISMYKHHDCKCDLCRKANADIERLRRLKIK